MPQITSVNAAPFNMRDRRFIIALIAKNKGVAAALKRADNPATEVINGIFISASIVVESSCLAFSAASFNL